MLEFPNFNPIAIDLGVLKIRWYGLMYLLGFATAWWLGRRRARDSWRGFKAVEVDDLLFFVALGAIMGGRVGYMLFYDLHRFLGDPLSVVRIWEGGMSFHGGLLGAIIALAFFARAKGKTFFQVADFAAPLAAPGIGYGRIGNFINGQLWGRETDLPWAMVFPDPRAAGIPRHPSQLYEAFLEGLCLFVIVWLFSARPRPVMAVSGVFLLFYGGFRFGVEFVRQPDGFVAFGWVTMGQALSSPMILAGMGLLALAYRLGRSTLGDPPAKVKEGD